MFSLTSGSVNHIIYSDSDVLGRCPKCYNNNVSKVGEFSSNGTSTDCKKCNNCNNIFTQLDGSIKTLAESLTSGTIANIGFTSSGSTTGAIIGSSTIYQPPIDNNGYKFDQMNSNLGMINSNISNLYNKIDDLTNTIKELVRQNGNLMEKLATDPLNDIKKAISDFNLK